jgi:hypothetical protein
MIIRKVPTENVRKIDDIKTKDGRLVFTDGCGTMSITLRHKVRHIQYYVFLQTTLDLIALRGFSLINEYQ